MITLLVSCTQQGVTNYETTDQVRETLAAADIGCMDFEWQPPPSAAACSFRDAVPQDGLRSGWVVIYDDSEEAEGAFRRCTAGGVNGGQMLFREGQSWVAMVEAYASDRTTTSNIDDQDFVAEVAEVLGSTVVNC